MPSKCPPRTPIILYDNCMSANEAEYYDSLSTCEAPPLDPSLALSKIVEIPADMYQHFVADEQFQAMLSRMFDEISIPQFRALYILQIGTLALESPQAEQMVASKRFSRVLLAYDAVDSCISSHASKHLCNDVDGITPESNDTAFEDIPVDLFAHIHNWGQDYHIRYPVLPIGDWPIPKREPKLTKTSRPGWIMPGDSDDEELGHDGKECE
ncbi:hypothetical protein MPER_11054 [Moniliophthora perniciosa FA553]|nr:hypothetical protein MPER_11054 [Moniliophthora perniciosa FA553]